jgi:hypothetical protein
MCLLLICCSFDCTEYFGCFYLLFFVSMYCNLGMAYILSFYCVGANTSRMLFNGIVMPAQLLLSGFLFLISRMQPWYACHYCEDNLVFLSSIRDVRYKWAVYISPMSYFLAGTFYNEFSGNEDALGTNSFDDLADFYG